MMYVLGFDEIFSLEVGMTGKLPRRKFEIKRIETYKEVITYTEATITIRVEIHLGYYLSHQHL